MGIMVNFLLWVTRDLYHQPYYPKVWMKAGGVSGLGIQGLGFRMQGLRFGAVLAACIPLRLRTPSSRGSGPKTIRWLRLRFLQGAVLWARA